MISIGFEHGPGSGPSVPYTFLSLATARKCGFAKGFLGFLGNHQKSVFSGRRPFAQNAVFPMLFEGFRVVPGRSVFLADHPASHVKRKRIACYMSSIPGRGGGWMGFPRTGYPRTGVKDKR